MSAVCLTGMTGLKERTSLNASVNRVINDLLLIKDDAVFTGTYFTILCADDRYSISKLDLASGSLIKVRDDHLESGVRFKMPVEFRFSSSGFPLPGYSGKATLENRNKVSTSIIVSSYGRVRTE